MAKLCTPSESSANLNHRAPFKHWRPSSNLPGTWTYWLLSNVLCWCHTSMSTIFHSHPSKISASALSKWHTKLYVLLHATQPKFYSWKHSTMVEHRKDMMLHAWRDFRLFFLWGKHWNFEISWSQNPQYDIIQMAGWWRAVQKFLSSLWINQHRCGIKGLRDQDENAHQNRDSFISSCKSHFF